MRTRIAINLFMAAPDAMKPSILIFFIWYWYLGLGNKMYSISFT